MGFMDKLLGLGGSKSDSKKQKIREIFNSSVKNGDSYEVLATTNLETNHTLLNEVRTISNYIVGYRDSEDPEIVIIETNDDLSSFSGPVYCKKSECNEAKFIESQGTFVISNPKLGDKPVNFFVIVSTHMGSHVIKVSYVNEYTPFYEFYVNKFAK